MRSWWQQMRAGSRFQLLLAPTWLAVGPGSQLVELVVWDEILLNHLQQLRNTKLVHTGAFFMRLGS